MHSHFVLYLGLCPSEQDQIHNGATLCVAYPILSIPCLLMPWRLKEPGHQQAWYWPNKPENFVSSINRFNPMSCIFRANIHFFIYLFFFFFKQTYICARFSYLSLSLKSYGIFFTFPQKKDNNIPIWQIQLISWLLMSWWLQDTGHQQT